MQFQLVLGQAGRLAGCCAIEGQGQTFSLNMGNAVAASMQPPGSNLILCHCLHQRLLRTVQGTESVSRISDSIQHSFLFDPGMPTRLLPPSLSDPHGGQAQLVWSSFPLLLKRLYVTPLCDKVAYLKEGANITASLCSSQAGTRDSGLCPKCVSRFV